MDVTVVVLAYNQLEYTRNLLDSLRSSGIADANVIVVDNGSTDGTGEFLAARPELKILTLMPNRGFGFGWRQGALASSTEWTVLFGNDVLVAPHWLEGLLSFAEEHRLDLASPAMCEGDLDYDLPVYAGQFVQAMSNVKRPGVAHAVCLMVHRRVFDGIGPPVDDPRLGGYEDDEFFRRARRAGILMGITGRSFIHHFGSVTQKSIIANSKGAVKSLGDREYYRRKTGQTWPKRKVVQLRNGLRRAWWKHSEMWRFGRTLHSKRSQGEWRYL
jgi:N-acetylglucosaminyl-diphospho-decaprenol L-rhamnosyltransferase